MPRFIKSSKPLLLLATMILSVNIFAGGAVTFNPTSIPCGTLGCGPVTITNLSGRTVWFAGFAVNYRSPRDPLTDFSYIYTGCTNGVILPGSSCDAVFNPNGFSLIPGTYSARPLFNRTLNEQPQNIFRLFLSIGAGVECTDDSQCTSPDTCTAGSCGGGAPASTCLNGVQEGAEACDSYDQSGTAECTPICTINADGDGYCAGSEFYYNTDCQDEGSGCAIDNDCTNNASNMFCDAGNCIRQKGFGELCAANNECASNNCSTTCIAPP